MFQRSIAGDLDVSKLKPLKAYMSKINTGTIGDMAVKLCQVQQFKISVSIYTRKVK